MKVPTLDMQAHLGQVGDAIKAAVGEVIDSGGFILGPKVAELEGRIAEYVGAGHGIGVSSGTDALLIALMALDVGHGDIVVTTPYSFFATAGVIARLGATPAFVDIDPKSYNMDPEALAAWFADHPEQVSKVKAIMPVHLYGQCADLERISKIAADHGKPIVEDAAQAIGSNCEVSGEVKGAGSVGAFGCFSFFPSKNLGGIGDGGMVVTSDDALAEKTRVLRVHGGKPKYHHAIIGGNFRLDAIQAAAILVKLDHLERWHAERAQRAEYYDSNLQVEQVCPPERVGGRHIYNQYVISVTDRRDELQAYLREHGISTAIYYPIPLHLQLCFANLGYQPGQLPNSEHAATHTLALPVYPELTREMQDHVIKTIGDFFA